MKTILFALMLLAAPAIAAQDVPGAISDLQRSIAAQEKTQAQLAAVTAQRDAFEHVLDTAGQVSTEKDKAIKDRDAVIAARDKQIARDKQSRVTLISTGIGLPGGLLFAAGIAAVVLGLTALGLRCVAIGAFLIGLGLGVALYAPQLALLAVAMAAVVGLGAVAWIIWDVRQHKDAAINLDSAIKQLGNAKTIAVDKVGEAASIVDEAVSGTLAAKIMKQSAVAGAKS